MSLPIIRSQKLHGIFRGTALSPDVHQYKNIKYADIDHRFALPRIIRDYHDRTIDATKQGPICPQDTLYRDSIVGIPESEVTDVEVEFDELNCACVVVTKPAQTEAPIPVVCWIHGGGNIAGTPYRRLCDFTRFVEYSTKIGKPVIGVGIQYRVGMLGFLPHDGIGNFGLHDQHTALKWINENIGEFGGDKNRITLMGQSSGSWCAIMQSIKNSVEKTNLFQRAAFFSGSTSSIPLISLKDYSLKAQEIAEICETNVEGLEHICCEKIIKASQHDLGMTVAFPVDDGSFLPGELFRSFPTNLDACIISDCKEDGYFWIEYMDEPEKLVELISKQPSGPEIISSYKMNDGSPETIADFLTDCIFCSANDRLDIKLRNSTNVTVQRIFFDLTNPHDFKFGNNHMIDVICLFDAYPVRDKRKSELIRQFQQMMISFVYGIEPWNNNQALAITDDGFDLVNIGERNKYRRLETFADVEKFEKLHYDVFHKLAMTGW